MPSKKIQRHKKITIYYIVIPIVLTIVVWFYSYLNNDIFDETVLSFLIDKFFLPFYITIFWVVFSLYLENEEKLMDKTYKFQLLFILMSITFLMLLKALFRDYF